MEPSSSSSSIGDEEDMERGLEQSIEEKKNLAASEQTLPNRQCRICYAPEQASGADPILLLGCACKGDISYGHQSCLQKWFSKRFQRNQTLDCEVCRSPLGASVKKIIRSISTAEVIEQAPRLLILLQVPLNDLDHSQVPFETPDFYQLPPEIQRSLEASFERLEQEQRRDQSRRRETFETSQSIPADFEALEALSEDAIGDHFTRLQLDESLGDDFLQLLEVRNTGLRQDPSVARVFTQHPDPSFGASYEDEGTDHPTVYPEGLVVRVPILEPADVIHPHMEDVLDRLSMQAVQFVNFHGGGLILLPNFLDKFFLDMDELEASSMPDIDSEFQDNDDIPIVIPVLNDSSGGPDPVLAEAARQTDSIPRRVITYGRFQMFQLFQ